MLETIDLEECLSQDTYRRAKGRLEIRLGVLQRRLRGQGIPVLIVFEGWDAAGKGALINELILPLDRRGVKVHPLWLLKEVYRGHSFLWPFWVCLPPRGRIAIFDRSWYGQVLDERVERRVTGEAVEAAFRDILAFERQMTDDGAIVIKLFLHLSKKEQGRRLRKLAACPETAWRVTDEDLRRHRRYNRYRLAVEDMLERTHSPAAPWTVVPAHDRRLASVRVLETVERAMERALRRPARQTRPARLPPLRRPSVLDNVDLSLRLEEDLYKRALDKEQDRLRSLQGEIFRRGIPVVVVYEGWDAAGKGGNIRRLTAKLDPRGYEVVPVGPPNDAEKARHYLWRFWTAMPRRGFLTIFDRSWYGRVLVERVETFCTTTEWKRAYAEINEMERHLVDWGTILVKFWLEIDPDEQLRRFKERQKAPLKRWKITEEDWRNREKMPQYREAVRDMLARTHTLWAPWIVVESNCKRYARVKVIRSVIAALEARL